MILAISHSGDISLREPNRFDRFHVDASGTRLREVGDALLAAGVGAITDDGKARIQVSFLHQAAGALARDDSWRADFEAMLDYAAQASWLTEDRAEITSHIEGLPS